ncbi:MAG: CBS domain-containing protein [Rhodospirillales bacterium]
MIVSELLKKKHRSVVTAYPSTTVGDAVGLFKEKKIGAIMICVPDGTIVGIVTERDVLHSQAEIGAATMKLKVEEIMSHVYTCKPDDDLKSVMRLMAFKHVRHVPVVVDGELKGMISISDIIGSQLDETQLEVDVLRDYARGH